VDVFLQTFHFDRVALLDLHIIADNSFSVCDEEESAGVGNGKGLSNVESFDIFDCSHSVEQFHVSTEVRRLSNSFMLIFSSQIAWLASILRCHSPRNVGIVRWLRRGFILNVDSRLQAGRIYQNGPAAVLWRQNRRIRPRNVDRLEESRRFAPSAKIATFCRKVCPTLNLLSNFPVDVRYVTMSGANFAEVWKGVVDGEIAVLDSEAAAQYNIRSKYIDR